MGYLNEVPEEYLTELELKNKGFIRISDLDGLLEGKIKIICQVVEVIVSGLRLLVLLVLDQEKKLEMSPLKILINS